MNPSWTAQHHASQLTHAWVYDDSSTASTMGCSLTTSFVLLLYDHALTFGDEVNEFWTLRPSPTGALILIVRYFALLSRGLDVFGLIFHSIAAFFYTGWTPTPIPEVGPMKKKKNLRGSG
ncbi:hypothetical protein K439DRAFT_1610460 [Ramaria rubella]|nr:hypothetical protein K439DRAFT_1610460 [Ramaria rubella]